MALHNGLVGTVNLKNQIVEDIGATTFISRPETADDSTFDHNGLDGILVVSIVAIGR